MAITGEVYKIEKLDDAYKRMVLWIIFKESDGTEHAFYQGAALLEKDGHKVWPFYFTYEQIAGMDATALDSWCQQVVKSQAENVIRNLARTVVNDALAKDSLPSLVGKKYTIEDAATAVDGVRVKDDGTLIAEVK